MKWLEYALLAALFSSATTLTFKYILNKGIKIPLLLFYVFLLATIFSAAYIIYTKQPLKIEAPLLLPIVLAVIVGIAGSYLLFKAVDIAPNPGYVSAISALQAVVVTLAAVVLFKSELSFVKGIGIAAAIASVVLLSIK